MKGIDCVSNSIFILENTESHIYFVSYIQLTNKGSLRINLRKFKNINKRLSKKLVRYIISKHVVYYTISNDCVEINKLILSGPKHIIKRSLDRRKNLKLIRTLHVYNL